MRSPRLIIPLTALLWLHLAPLGSAQPQSSAAPVVPPGLDIRVWAREPMLKNPVALHFDDRGRLYVVETARRGTVDIDIRSHQTWIIDDLANQSVEDLRRFFREKMAPEKSLENARWLRDYNLDGSHDWRDLTAFSERVHLLLAENSPDKADRAFVFAEGFNEEINGVIAGVMPWQNDVFVTVYPDLWRLRDENNDGVADSRESVFRGFGVHAAFDGHDLHGLTAGPDGKIYFSVGDNGFSVVNKEGRRLHHPNTGGVLRMNPDGSDLEVFAIGLRNPQEIAFDEYGNLFSVDNDGDLEDERERFVYIVEGSDSGWRLHWQFRDPGWARFTLQPNYNPWTAERMWTPHFQGQPAHLTPPLSNYSVGPGSFKYNPGAALSDRYRRHFFLIQFPVQKVTAFQVQPKGAAFEMVNEHTLVSGLMASAVNFGPDGALYVADWDGLWTPNDKGAIWKLDDPRAALSPVRQEVKQWLAEGPRSCSQETLLERLGHADARIRQQAQFELARRAEASPLLALAQRQSAPQLARVHALWGLTQMRHSLHPSQLPFADPDPEIRSQSAKTAGDLRLRDASPALTRLLRDASPRVQFHAALALGKAGNADSLPAIVQLLSENQNQDPFIRHACVMALAGIGNLPLLQSLAQHPSSAVRIAAVVSLRRLLSPAAAAFLRDPHPDVQREAVRAIHDDDGIPSALPALASLLEDPDPPADEAVLRRALNASLRLGDRPAALRLIRFALNPSRPIALRIEALDCLANWTRTPFVDRVEGLVRGITPPDPEAGRSTLEAHLAALFDQSNPALTPALARLVLENNLSADPRLFADWAADENQKPEIRVRSLEILAQKNGPGFPRILQSALASAEPELRAKAIALLAQINPADFIAFVQKHFPAFSLKEKQKAFLLLSRANSTEAAEFLTHHLDLVWTGQALPELVLDIIEACRASNQPSLQSRILAYDNAFSNRTALAKFRPALSGGDPAAGRDLFRNHVNAQCVRCHEAGGEGVQAGPVLAGIATRLTPEMLLESLVDPSARIADGFASILLVTRQGEEIEGVKLRETPQDIVLRVLSGEQRAIPKTSVLSQVNRSVSAMPPMTDILTPLEIRDLAAYLATLK